MLTVIPQNMEVVKASRFPSGRKSSVTDAMCRCTSFTVRGFHSLRADVDLCVARGILRGFGGVLHLAHVGGLRLLQDGRCMALGRLDDALVRLLEGRGADLRIVAEGRGLGYGVRCS